MAKKTPSAVSNLKPKPGDPQPLRVLIIEDSVDDATLLLHALRRGGYEVTNTVVDTAAAMRAALELQDWDVITSDHTMPNFSAPAALAIARELCPDLPFIIVSGEIDLHLAVSMMKDGASDYIQKEELPRLVPTIERELHQAKIRREHRQMEDALEISEAGYRRLFETAQDGILIINADTGQIQDVNPFLIEMLGYSKEEFLGKKLWEVGAFKDIEASKIAFAELQSKGYVRYEDLPLENSVGEHVDVEFVSNVYFVNQTKVAQCNIRNITKRKEAEDMLRESERRYHELSIIDDLTQLYNSRHFYQQLKAEIERADRYKQPLTLLLLDIDNFKQFNDAYGHIEGDRVLTRFGQMIKGCLRQTDSAYRYGGEEFTILLPMSTSEDGVVTAERVKTELKKEVFPPVSGKKVHMTVSVGLVQYKPPEDIKAFVHRVDQLMYQAKKNGKNRLCFES
jgi:diguanylate cyclase (GGDEF)-like protein/PAS domain S-box-containing protein